MRLYRTLPQGGGIAIDDLGTGYASLANLRAFPFDRIKIDRSFVRNVDPNAQTSAIVRAVLGLGKGLGPPVVAEGVETPEELAFLTAGGCAEVQGYLFGRPPPSTGTRPAPARTRCRVRAMQSGTAGRPDGSPGDGPYRKAATRTPAAITQRASVCHTALRRSFRAKRSRRRASPVPASSKRTSRR